MKEPILAAIDPSNGYAYFGMNDYSNKIVQVHLSDLTRVTALTLPPEETHLSAAVIHQASGYAYFGTHTDPARVIRVNIKEMLNKLYLPLILRN